ncbi:hypothetical protein PVAP13_4NG084000 [Panicum virgatum]|uniref:Uncharacterized protein n=1 Tax=Panicum virgatum TaxID=38727 RepID=A0A8T0T1P2_PANVG|nr:hypothetical protein PVAP13_4NG084000 [Panicum virgatum]
MTPEPEKASFAEGPMAQRMLQLCTRQPLARMDLNQTQSSKFGALPPILEPILCKFFFSFAKLWVLHRSCRQIEYHAQIYSALICAHEFWLLPLYLPWKSLDSRGGSSPLHPLAPSLDFG